MLPSAPTVIVFAREYDQPSATLAALQFLCLLLAVPPANPNPSPNPNPNPNPNPSQVPFLLVSTAALQLPMVVGDEAARPVSNHDHATPTVGRGRPPRPPSPPAKTNSNSKSTRAPPNPHPDRGQASRLIKEVEGWLATLGAANPNPNPHPNPNPNPNPDPNPNPIPNPNQVPPPPCS